MQRNRPLILGAIILGILAIGLTLLARRQPQAVAPTAAAAPTPVVKQLVAARTIPPRTVITPDMVREDTLSTPAVTGSISDRGAIVGKLTGDFVRNGDPFTSAVLIAPVKRSAPANFLVPAGTRAIAVMVDPNNTMGGIIDVGDRVDVVVVHRIKFRNEANQDGESRSGRTIGQNILVLATDAALKQATAPPAPAPGAPVDPNAPPAPAPTPAPPPPPAAANAPPPKVRLVLAATPEVAERLAAAQGLGEIHLTLRDGVSRDALPVPEVFEYPIRTLGRTVPLQNNAAAAGANRTANANSGQSQRPTYSPRSNYSPRDIESLNRSPREPIGPPMPPMPTGIIGGSPGSGAVNNVEAGTEVTVIRGTDKSKVVVPQR